MGLKELRAMKIGEEKKISSTLAVWCVLRVPGGWIYQSSGENPVHTYVPEQNIPFQMKLFSGVQATIYVDDMRKLNPAGNADPVVTTGEAVAEHEMRGK